MTEKQIKTKERVADFGEVYTGMEQVRAMLGLLPDDVVDVKTTFFEPAMGNGNFLEEILKQKLEDAVSKSSSKHHLRINALRCVASIYGVDIQEDNVIEARERMMTVLRDELTNLCGLGLDRQLASAVSKVLQRNLLCGDTLQAVAKTGEPLVFCEWTIRDNGKIVCKEFRYDDMLKNNGEAKECLRVLRYSWLKPDVEKKVA